MRTITGFKDNANNTSSFEDNPQQLADNLNASYARFDPSSQTGNNINNPRTQIPDTISDHLSIDSSSVLKIFKSLSTRKACGPDNVTPKLLKGCANQLAGVYAKIFNICVNTYIPSIWKTANIVPVPKKSCPKELNDFRPISLTSVPFKCLERIVLKELLKQTESSLDKNQFAYRKSRCVDDATLTLSHILLKHLEKPKSYTRTLFIDFSSAFNTIKPDILINKLKSLGVSDGLCHFIHDFLCDRRQRVRVGDYFSNILVLNIGSPQGCVLSTVLFILYTNDLISFSPNYHIIKYADDTAIVGLFDSRNIDSYVGEINAVSDWCVANNLLLNVSKTKEIIFDFRRTHDVHQTIKMDNSEVSIVKSYKYLGTIIDQDLTWSEHINNVFTKCQQRLYFLFFYLFFLRTLGKLNVPTVDNKILHLFYSSVVQRVLSFGCIIWWNSVTLKNKNKLNKICKYAKKITNSDITPLQLLSDERTRSKVKRIREDPDHPLYSFYYYKLFGEPKTFRPIPCRFFENTRCELWCATRLSVGSLVIHYLCK